MNTLKKMQTSPLPPGDGPVPTFVDDFSILSLNDAKDGVLRIACFGVIDGGGPGAPAAGAVPVARLVLTVEKARVLAEALNHHTGGGNGPNLRDAINENKPH